MAKDKNKEKKAKGLFARLIEKVDKKMEERAKSSPCCCGSGKAENNSC